MNEVAKLVYADATAGGELSAESAAVEALQGPDFGPQTVIGVLHPSPRHLSRWRARAGGGGYPEGGDVAGEGGVYAGALAEDKGDVEEGAAEGRAAQPRRRPHAAAQHALRTQLDAK